MLEKNLLEEFENKPSKLKSGNRVFNNRYVFKEKIGEGGLCEVYDVLETYSEYFNESRNLVVKIPSKEMLKKKDIAAFIYSEYSILNKIYHENVVKITDFGIDEVSQVPYLVMNKLEGRLLVNMPLLDIDKKMSKQLAYSLYKAIDYIHSMQIVHADINPTNIMVRENGEASVFDFGISQNIANQASFNLSYSKIKAFNPIYAAPEVLEGSTPNVSSDMFSLACVMYEVYTRRLPFVESSKELKERPLKRNDLTQIPFFQKAWFRKSLSHDANKRPLKIPFCIHIKIIFNIFIK